MRYQVLILTGDTVFGRMLQLEFEGWHLTAGLASGQEAAGSADVTIVDLDSASVPPEGSYGYLIGFSRLPAVSADEDARRCAMILRRPFRMSLLRREVLSGLGTVPQERIPESGNAPGLCLSGAGLACGGRTVSLTPTERRLTELLLRADGKPVPRAELAAQMEAPAKGKLEVYLSSVRKKLRGVCAGASLECVRGVGYCLIPDAKKAKTT